MRGGYVCDLPANEYYDDALSRSIKFACFDEEVQDIVSHIRCDYQKLESNGRGEA